MDTLSDLLRGVRADGAVLGRSRLSSPWALRFTDGAALSLVTLVQGGARLTHGTGVPVPLGEGESALVRGPEPFLLTGTGQDPPMGVEEVRCLDPAERAGVCVGSGGEGQDGPGTVLLAGAFPVHGALGSRLLDTLPPLAVVPPEGDHDTSLDLVSAELAVRRPGQEAVLERMLEWLLVCTLRAWFDRAGSRAPAWYRALSDPVAGPALREIHARPAHRWTVAALAREADVSRSTLAARFTDVVGEPPLAYLTGWRMALAAEMLAEPGSTVASVARRVGYADPFGFSAAFKRHTGSAPSAHRAGADLPG